MKNSKNNLFLLLLCLFCSSLAIAQSDETINTDRPDQSEGVYTLPKGQFQIENGYVFSKEDSSANLMLRYGLITNTEIRLEGDFDLHTPDFSSTTFSVKQRLYESEQRFIPSVGLIGYGQYSKTEAKAYTFDACLAFESSLTNVLSLAYGASSSGQFENLDVTAQINYVPTNNKFWTFVEYYASYNGTRAPEHNINAGFAYLLTPTLQLDISSGRTLWQDEPQYFIGAGFGLLIR